MTSRTVAIIQARLSSTRLPRKVLKDLGGKPVLQHVVDRLKKSELIDCVIVATTEDDEDDELIDFCRSASVDFFRGEKADVLDRFYRCAKSTSASAVVRVTSDNPLIDTEVVNNTMQLFHSTGADYAANNLVKTFPHGMDVEVMSMGSLRDACKLATRESDREHVTQYIRRNTQHFQLVNLRAKQDWHDIRITLDDNRDYDLLNLVVDILGPDATLSEIVNLFKQRPELKAINLSSTVAHAAYNNALNLV